MQDMIFLSPSQAFCGHNTDAPVIAVKYCERGFYPIYTHATPEQLNGPDITPEIQQAALIGSMFGWTVPGARAAADYFAAQERAALAHN